MHWHTLQHQCHFSKEFGLALRCRLLQAACLPLLSRDPQRQQHLESLGLSNDIDLTSTSSAFITLLKRRSVRRYGNLLLCFTQAMKSSTVFWRDIVDCASALISKEHQRLSPLPIRDHLHLHKGAISLPTPCDIRRKVRPTSKSATIQVYRTGQAIARCFHDWRDQPTLSHFGKCTVLRESKSLWLALSMVLTSFSL
mmetsp:Transcript_1887/g.11372  ORF Transcript_1887/g.11372 Transcript_1887/m.11372 type:complete len:197 (-) Transcript_1887:39-629(-)